MLKIKVLLAGAASALLVSFWALNVSASPTNNYWMAASDGGIFSFGDAGFYGSTGGMKLNKPIVGMTGSYGGEGYYLVASDGGVFTFGDAVYHGSLQDDPNTAWMFTAGYRKAVGIVRSDDGGGYWIYDSLGAIWPFGGAEWISIGGYVGGNSSNKPMVNMAVRPYDVADPEPYGAWLVATDGGVFTAGGADFFGSTGGIKLNKPIVGIAPTMTGRGYWLVASDGGIFAFGDAGYYGSTGNIILNKPVVGMIPSFSDQGYWLVASDGGVFAFGDAEFVGSTGGIKLNQPIVNAASTFSY